MAEVPPVSALADVAIMWGEDGWLTPPLQPFVPPTTPVIGRARTVQLMHADTGPGMALAFDLLSGELDGDMVVWAGVEEVAGATWGEILSLAAYHRGARGVLVDGAVRDVDDMRAIGLPVYGTRTAVVGPNATVHAVAVDVAVRVGGVVVTPGDVIVADASGCIRLAASRADDLVAAGAAYAAGETSLVAALAAGEPLASAYAIKKQAVDPLRR